MLTRLRVGRVLKSNSLKRFAIPGGANPRDRFDKASRYASYVAPRINPVAITLLLLDDALCASPWPVESKLIFQIEDAGASLRSFRFALSPSGGFQRFNLPGAILSRRRPTFRGGVRRPVWTSRPRALLALISPILGRDRQARARESAMLLHAIPLADAP